MLPSRCQISNEPQFHQAQGEHDGVLEGEERQHYEAVPCQQGVPFLYAAKATQDWQEQGPQQATRRQDLPDDQRVQNCTIR